MRRLKMRVAVVSVLTAIVGALTPMPAHAAFSHPETAAMVRLLSGADHLDSQLRSRIEEASVTVDAAEYLNLVVREALTDDGVASRWSAELDSAVTGYAPNARDLLVSLHTSVADSEIARMAQFVAPLGGDDVYMFVRFLLDPRLIAAIPTPSAPRPPRLIPPPDPSRSVLSTVDHEGDLREGGPYAPICTPHIWASGGSPEDKFSHYWIKGHLEWCYDYIRVSGVHHFPEVFTRKSFEPFVVYSLTNYYRNDGRYQSGLTPDWRFEEHRGYEHVWQPNFETCFVFGAGCAFSETMYLSAFGYNDGSGRVHDYISIVKM